MQNNPVGGFIDYGRENVILQMFSCCSRKRSEFCKPVTKLTSNFFYPDTFLSCLYLQLAFPWRLHCVTIFAIFWYCSLFPKAQADAEGFHCCKCSALKWLTLISRVEFLFLKMLWTGFLKLNESSFLWHCRGKLTSAGGHSFSCCPVFSTICDSAQRKKCASLFYYK